nr:MAG TPA: hypothetical protein [Caudoviricetes sp.]
MERITFDGNFCDIVQCRELPCPYDNNCTQKQVWDRLKLYEDARISPTAAAHARQIEDGLNEDGYSVAWMVELMKADKDGRLVVLPCKVGERWADADGRAVRITAVIVSIEPFGTNINIYFDDEGATPDDAGSACAANWDYFSRHYTCIEVERAMEGKKGA